MISFIIFHAAVFGLSVAIAAAKIGDPIRQLSARIWPTCTFHWIDAEGVKSSFQQTWWSALFNCAPCVAVWVGCAFSTYFWSPAREAVQALWTRPLDAMLVDGLSACGISWLAIHLSSGLIEALHEIAKGLKRKILKRKIAKGLKRK